MKATHNLSKYILVLVVLVVFLENFSIDNARIQVRLEQEIQN